MDAKPLSWPLFGNLKEVGLINCAYEFVMKRVCLFVGEEVPLCLKCHNV